MARKSGVPRLLLLEFLPSALRRNDGSMMFPFFQGLAREKGAEVLWLCFGVPLQHTPSKAGGLIGFADLPKKDLATLGKHLKRFRPTHVLSSDLILGAARKAILASSPKPSCLVRPTESGIEEAPQGLTPDAVVLDQRDPYRFTRCGWFLDWLGLGDAAWERRNLIESARPDYGAVLADAAARASTAMITLVSGVHCGYNRTARLNPLFKDVLPSSYAAREEMHPGCTFCGANRPSFTPPGADVLALVERQLRGILETGGPHGRSKGVYEVYDINVFWDFDRFFEIVLRLKMPPSVFLFNPRIDDVLRVRERIERMLPALAKAGHEARIMSMGVENFSERENARFNKGISPEQVGEFLALAQRWEGAYPGVFKPFRAGSGEVELGLILFTPWTTLEDVRINLERASEFHFAENGYWLYSTLQLKKGRPLHLLAQKEGDLLAASIPDKGQIYGFTKNDGSASTMVPWRFRDPKVRDYFAILVRVCAAAREGHDCDLFRGEALFTLACGLYLEANKHGATSPLKIARALLTAMEAARPPYSRQAILREVFRAVAPPPPLAPVLTPVVVHALPASVAEIERLVARGRKKSPEAFAQVEVLSIAESEPVGSGRIRIALRIAGRDMSVDLLGLEAKGPAFLRLSRFKVVYQGEQPIPSPSAKKLVRFLESIDGLSGSAPRRG